MEQRKAGAHGEPAGVGRGKSGNGHYETMSFTESYTAREAATKEDTEVGAGSFGLWVGVAPEFSEFDNENADGGAGREEYSKYLSVEGSGQMGLVMTPFLRSQMKQGVGKALEARPFYDKKLWDDRRSWVIPPHIVADKVSALCAHGDTLPQHARHRPPRGRCHPCP